LNFKSQVNENVRIQEFATWSQAELQVSGQRECQNSRIYLPIAKLNFKSQVQVNKNLFKNLPTTYTAVFYTTDRPNKTEFYHICFSHYYITCNLFVNCNSYTDLCCTVRSFGRMFGVVFYVSR
jgi:hypothetical protein